MKYLLAHFCRILENLNPYIAIHFYRKKVLFHPVILIDFFHFHQKLILTFHYYFKQKWETLFQFDLL